MSGLRAGTRVQCLNWKQRSTSARNDFFPFTAFASIVEGHDSEEPVDIACSSSFTETRRFLGVCHDQFFVLSLTAPLQARPESCSALRELRKRSLSFMHVNVQSLHLTL